MDSAWARRGELNRGPRRTSACSDFSREGALPIAGYVPEALAPRPTVGFMICLKLPPACARLRHVACNARHPAGRKAPLTVRGSVRLLRLTRKALASMNSFQAVMKL